MLYMSIEDIKRQGRGAARKVRQRGAMKWQGVSASGHVPAQRGEHICCGAAGSARSTAAWPAAHGRSWQA